jgi:phosphatidylinositol alpha-1,6-mannosyltransferase
MPNKQILLISRNMPPLIGGMERLMQNTANILDKHYSVTVIAPKGASAHLPDHIHVHGLPASPIFFILLSIPLALWLAGKNKYHLVIGGSGVMAPVIALVQKIFKCRGVVFVHGLDIIANNAVYQAIFVRALRHIDTLIANSNNTKALTVATGINESKIHIIHPGTNLPNIDKAKSREYLDQKYALQNKKILLSVGRITPRKGLKEFVQNAMPALCQHDNDIILLVAGDHPNQGLTKSAKLPTEIAAISFELGIQDSIIFLGSISDDELSHCYAGADCLIFPLINIPGDVEGFGMVAIEAAAHGTPTIAFDEGGVSDAIKGTTSGALITKGSYTQFTQAVIEVVSKTSAIDSETCKCFASEFSWVKFEQSLLKLLKP